MEAGFDTRPPHIVAQPVAVLAAHDVEMEHMVAVHHLRQGERQAGKPLVIRPRELAPTVRPTVEERQLMAEYQSLYSLHAIVEPEFVVDVALGLRVVTQGTQALCDGVISGDDEPRLAGRAQVLCRIKAIAAAQAECTNTMPVKTRADGLRRIL